MFYFFHVTFIESKSCETAVAVAHFPFPTGQKSKKKGKYLNPNIVFLIFKGLFSTITIQRLASPCIYCYSNNV